MISIILTVALIGVLVWTLITFLPMDDAFKKVIIGISILLVLIFIFDHLGFLHIPIK